MFLWVIHTPHPTGRVPSTCQFWGSPLLTPTTKNNQNWHGNTYVRACFYSVSHAPIPRGPSAPNFGVCLLIHTPADI